MSHVPVDAHQALRINRTLMAAASSALVILLLTFYWHEGYLPGRPYAIAVAAITWLVVFFYAVFRMGLNLRFADPSLTFAQVSSAVAVLVYVNFHLEAARGAFLLVYIMAMLFAVFRLSTGQLLIIIAPVLAAHAMSIALLQNRGLDPDELHIELVQWVVLVVVLLWFAQVAGYISDMRRRLRTLAVRDELTAVYNRRHMADMLAGETARVARRGGAFCVLMLDLDRFKSINDTYGHATGDEVLRRFATLVKQQIRPADYLGRYGGEEFLLILPDTALAPGVIVAERIREATRAAKWGSTHPGLAVTVSIGVQECNRNTAGDAIVAGADAALYRAKQAGRDRVEYTAPRAEPLLQP
ncbi:MAG TPA: GGDEF domain-containing protein [Burkholderiales bacterium]|nr:GGDEF domain-containing protein [Burkholderiales bacterium]